MTLLILIVVIIGVAVCVWFLAKRSAKPKDSLLPMTQPPPPIVPPASPAVAPQSEGVASPPESPVSAPPFTTPL